MKILIIILQVFWFVIVAASSLLTLLMFAFADSPDLGKAVARMFWPVVVIGMASFCLGAMLMRHHTSWWQIPLAYLLALIPPAMLIVRIKLMSR